MTRQKSPWQALDSGFDSPSLHCCRGVARRFSRPGILEGVVTLWHQALVAGGAHAGPSGGSMESGVLTGLKAMGISAPGQAQPQRPRGGMHPDLALELGDEFEDDEF